MSNLSSYTIRPATRKEIAAFIEKHHYSKSINGCNFKYGFALFSPEQNLVGAMFYGMTANHNNHLAVCNNRAQVLELRRLCCIDETPKNTESYFIGYTLRWLGKNWLPNGIIMSYCDLDYNHTGIIYNASNFICLGYRRSKKSIIYNGKKYHSMAKFRKKPIHQRIRRALETGEAYYKKSKGKLLYVYYLDKKIRKKKLSTRCLVDYSKLAVG